MFTNNRRYISQNETRDDYIALDLRLSSSTDIWEKAIEIMRGRIGGRYLDPMETLIQDDANKNGFAAMALCSLLIETLLQFREGFPQTPQRQNKRWYTQFLQTQLGNVFDQELAKRFYEDIRCGILHSAQTKNNSCLTYGKDYIARIQGNGVMMVDVQGMHSEITKYFGRYCDELMEMNNLSLRRNFINKMDDITKKREGNEILDNLWFAICEKENRIIERQYGRPFSFQVDPNGTDLRIIGGSKISREEIEKALYYWPNKRAIQMLDEGNYIFQIIRLCEDIANEIIERQIA